MKKMHEKILEVFESKILVGILYGVGIVIVLALVFSAGISVGFHKASFDRTWSENYERNFGEAPPGIGFNFDSNNFPNANGAVGKIIKITLPTIIVTDKDNTEKVILIQDGTKLEKMRTEIKSTDLAVNDFVVVIGSPNTTGQIEAKFIRVMPAGMPNGEPGIPLPAPIQ
jgi:hypothetical protein